MPPRRPSVMTLFLGWFLLSPLLVIVVTAAWSWRPALAAVLAGYLVLLALYLAQRGRPPRNAVAGR